MTIRTDIDRAIVAASRPLDTLKLIIGPSAWQGLYAELAVKDRYRGVPIERTADFPGFDLVPA